MKRWSIFGSAMASDAKQEAPPPVPAGAFGWGAMFKIRKRLDPPGAHHEPERGEEPTSVD